MKWFSQHIFIIKVTFFFTWKVILSDHIVRETLLRKWVFLHSPGLVFHHLISGSVTIIRCWHLQSRRSLPKWTGDWQWSDAAWFWTWEPTIALYCLCIFLLGSYVFSALLDKVSKIKLHRKKISNDWLWNRNSKWTSRSRIPSVLPRWGHESGHRNYGTWVVTRFVQIRCWNTCFLYIMYLTFYPGMDFYYKWRKLYFAILKKNPTDFWGFLFVVCVQRHILTYIHIVRTYIYTSVSCVPLTGQHRAEPLKTHCFLLPSTWILLPWASRIFLWNKMSPSMGHP